MLLILLLVIIALGVLLSDSFIQIPAYHYGIVERFGKRTGRILLEGLKFKLPFIEKVELISMQLFEIDVTATFTTLDRLNITCLGSLQYKPDPEIKDSKGRNIFITISEEIINSGIADTIQAKLGALGGVKTGDDFIKNRHALSDIINCFLRLETPPHINHDPQNCRVQGCKFSKCPPGMIDANKLMDFYSQHWVLIKELLDEEKKKVLDRSSVEKRYGIDIEYFALSDIKFSKETQESFEKDKQAEAREKAFKKKIKMAKSAVKELGASPQVALNAADKTLDPTVKKEIVSVEGETGVLGGFLGRFTKGGRDDTDSKPSQRS